MHDVTLPPSPDELARAHAALAAVRTAVAATIVGQTQLVEVLLTALLCGGHSLLVGVPGLAKTRSVQALAGALDLKFSRIQFTPDLLPTDITGGEILEGDATHGRVEFRFAPGPIFANLLLADEINRTPPRTQAALLEAMQERAVTSGGITHPLPQPFLVLATQNPIEQEGTFPLPEAQLDRFFFSIHLDYPDAAEEAEIVRRTTQGGVPAPRAVLAPDDVRELMALVPRVVAGDEVIAAAVRIIRATRPGPEAVPAIRDYVAWGAGPRGSQDLILGAKARALAAGRDRVELADLVALAPYVLRHRLVTNFAAERDGVRADDLIREVLAGVHVDV